MERKEKETGLTPKSRPEAGGGAAEQAASGRRCRRRSWMAAIFAALTLALISPAVVPQGTALAASETTVKSGWVKEKAGYCYYVKGKKLKNQWKTINGKKYYFGADGVRKTGWYTIAYKKKYRAYYFNSKGVCTKTGKTFSKSFISSLDTEIKAQKITSTTAKKTALKKLFSYLSSESFGYQRAYGVKATEQLDYVTYASAMLKDKKGSCYHFAAAFACLAKRATGYPVRICVGTSNAFNETSWQQHAWVEVKIGSTWYTFDPNAARFSSRNLSWSMQKSSSVKNKLYKVTTYTYVKL